MSLRAIFATRPIVFLGRFPTGADLLDGYYQRVSAIDRVVSGLSRVYLRTDGPARMLTVTTRMVGPGAWEVRISRRNPFQRRLALRLGQCSRAAFAHSIRALESPLAWEVFQGAPKRVLDLHGAVPEEAALLGESGRVGMFESLEGEAASRSDVLIGVSRRLIDHVVEKHHVDPSPLGLVMPIVTDVASDTAAEARSGAIYAGGFQPWQQMDKMFDFVHRHAEVPVTFLTPDPERVRRDFRDRFGGDFPGTSSTARPEELGGWYRRHRFGLILREASLINQVACPTKLAEYLGYGLVPIVDSADIGDFPHLMYRFVRYADPLPSPDAAEEMARANRAVFDQLQQANRASADALRAFFLEGNVGP